MYIVLYILKKITYTSFEFIKPSKVGIFSQRGQNVLIIKAPYCSTVPAGGLKSHMPRDGRDYHRFRWKLELAIPNLSVHAKVLWLEMSREDSKIKRMACLSLLSVGGEEEGLHRCIEHLSHVTVLSASFYLTFTATRGGRCYCVHLKGDATEPQKIK